jgi:hypothetical protein
MVKFPPREKNSFSPWFDRLAALSSGLSDVAELADSSDYESPQHNMSSAVAGLKAGPVEDQKDMFANTGLPSLASALISRPANDLFLASASRRILSMNVSSPLLLKSLGWAEPLAPPVLAHQLLSLARMHKVAGGGQQAGALSAIPAADADGNNQIAIHVSHLYRLLSQSYARFASDLQRLLRGEPWVWVGDCFVSAEQIAYASALDAKPYL